jgi:riboflavin kinase/FMN adenylyltransferase
LLIIDKKTASLTPKQHRCAYLENGCIFLDFDEIKEMSAASFVSFLKNHFINLEKIVVGYDFRFGKNALGDAKELKRLFSKEVLIVDEVFIDGLSVHSRVIRELLKDGDIKKATSLLGRYFKIVGEVIKGQGVGSKKLFATLNLEVKEFLIPKEGVYATFTKIGKTSYKSVTFIGKRLSTDGEFSIETHILDKKLNDIKADISISFVEYIRENRKFSSLDALKEQISKDLDFAREIIVGQI